MKSREIDWNKNKMKKAVLRTVEQTAAVSLILEKSRSFNIVALYIVFHNNFDNLEKNIIRIQFVFTDLYTLIQQRSFFFMNKSRIPEVWILDKMRQLGQKDILSAIKREVRIHIEQ